MWPVFPSSDFLFQELHMVGGAVNSMAICGSTTPGQLMLSHQHPVKVSFMSVSYPVPPSVGKYVLGM